MPSRQERRKAQKKKNKESKNKETKNKETKNKEINNPDDFLKEYYDYHNVSPEIDPLFHCRPLMRQSIRNITDKISVNHCVICGDTEKDGKLILVDTDRGQERLCEFCFMVQTNM